MNATSTAEYTGNLDTYDNQGSKVMSSGTWFKYEMARLNGEEDVIEGKTDVGGKGARFTRDSRSDVLIRRVFLSGDQHGGAEKLPNVWRGCF